MEENVGGIDRVLRIVLGGGLMLGALSGEIGAWGWLGAVPVLTGVFRFCPAYLPFGIKTCTRR